MTVPRTETIALFADRFETSDRARKKAACVALGRLIGVTDDRARRLIRAHLATPGQVVQRRSSKLTDEHVRGIARLLAGSIDKRGNVAMPMVDAVELARLNGVIPADLEVHPCTVGRRLRQLRLDRARLEAPEPSLVRRSLHSNHVHVVDFSPCPQWYIEGDGGIARHRIVPYKPSDFDGRLHLWRYLLVDHYSGAFFLRYYYSRGENAVDLVDFLWRAWSHKGRRDYPFHGVPLVVLGDLGAPLRAATTKNLLAGLGVQLELHSHGNAKASGAVETMHNHWERRFDARLRFQRATSVDDLNVRALELAIAINTHEAHSRHGRTRSSLWATIPQGKLRLCPAERQFLRLAHRNPATRKVDNYLHIWWHNAKFLVEGNVNPGEEVTVVESPFDDGLLRVWNVDGEQLDVTPLVEDPGSKQWVGGRDQIIGETSCAHPETPAQQVKRKVDEEPIALDNVFGAPLEDRSLDFLEPRHGIPAVAADELPRGRTVDSLWVCEWASEALGRSLTTTDAGRIDEAVGDGLCEDDVEQLVAGLFPELDGASPDHPTPTEGDREDPEPGSVLAFLTA